MVRKNEKTYPSAKKSIHAANTQQGVSLLGGLDLRENRSSLQIRTCLFQLLIKVEVWSKLIIIIEKFSG